MNHSSKASYRTFFQCKIYVTAAQDWSSNYCEMVGTKTMPTGKTYVGCRCRIFGYVAVFEGSAPSAPNIAPNQPVSVNIIIDNLDSSKFSSKEEELNVTRQMLADRLNTSAKRIVDLDIRKPPPDAFGALSSSAAQKQLTFTLRPPSRFDWTETNQLIWKINNTPADQISTTSLRIVPQSLVYFPTKRGEHLMEDGISQKACFAEFRSQKRFQQSTRDNATSERLRRDSNEKRDRCPDFKPDHSAGYGHECFTDKDYGYELC